MNIVILDDYQDAVRKLHCATRLDAYSAKVYTNTVKGLGQLSVRLKDADVIVLVRERTHISRQLIEKLPRLKLIAQTGKVGSHIDVGACTERGIAVAEGVGSPVAPAELTWALTLAAMRRLPQTQGRRNATQLWDWQCFARQDTGHLGLWPHRPNCGGLW
jgi:D-3-phosphoglycerate dehydrogenase